MNQFSVYTLATALVCVSMWVLVTATTAQVETDKGTSQLFVEILGCEATPEGGVRVVFQLDRDEVFEAGTALVEAMVSITGGETEVKQTMELPPTFEDMHGTPTALMQMDIIASEIEKIVAKPHHGGNLAFQPDVHLQLRLVDTYQEYVPGQQFADECDISLRPMADRDDAAAVQADDSTGTSAREDANVGTARVPDMGNNNNGGYQNSESISTSSYDAAIASARRAQHAYEGATKTLEHVSKSLARAAEEALLAGRIVESRREALDEAKKGDGPTGMNSHTGVVSIESTGSGEDREDSGDSEYVHVRQCAMALKVAVQFSRHCNHRVNNLTEQKQQAEDHLEKMMQLASTTARAASEASPKVTHDSGGGMSGVRSASSTESGWEPEAVSDATRPHAVSDATRSRNSGSVAPLNSSGAVHESMLTDGDVELINGVATVKYVPVAGGGGDLDGFLHDSEQGGGFGDPSAFDAVGYHDDDGHDGDSMARGTESSTSAGDISSHGHSGSTGAIGVVPSVEIVMPVKGAVFVFDNKEELVPVQVKITPADTDAAVAMYLDGMWIANKGAGADGLVKVLVDVTGRLARGRHVIEAVVLDIDANEASVAFDIQRDVDNSNILDKRQALAPGQSGLLPPEDAELITPEMLQTAMRSHGDGLPLGVKVLKTIDFSREDSSTSLLETVVPTGSDAGANGYCCNASYSASPPQELMLVSILNGCMQEANDFWSNRDFKEQGFCVWDHDRWYVDGWTRRRCTHRRQGVRDYMTHAGHAGPGTGAGAIFVAVAAWSDLFQHVALDVLPLLAAAIPLLAHPGVRVAMRDSPAARDMAATFGITSDRFVPWNIGMCADELIVPMYAPRLYLSYRPTAGFLLGNVALASRRGLWASSASGESYASSSSRPDDTVTDHGGSGTVGRTVIYVSRRLANYARIVANEAELIDALQAWVQDYYPEYRFVVHEGGDHAIERLGNNFDSDSNSSPEDTGSFGDGGETETSSSTNSSRSASASEHQAQSDADAWKLFASAAIVVGVHGGGLANIVHCTAGPSTAIVELLVGGSHARSYHQVTHGMGMQYCPLYLRSASGRAHYDGDEDARVTPKQLIAYMNYLRAIGAFAGVPMASTSTAGTATGESDSDPESHVRHGLPAVLQGQQRPAYPQSEWFYTNDADPPVYEPGIRPWKHLRFY